MSDSFESNCKIHLESNDFNNQRYLANLNPVNVACTNHSVNECECLRLIYSPFFIFQIQAGLQKSFMISSVMPPGGGMLIFEREIHDI